MNSFRFRKILRLASVAVLAASSSLFAEVQTVARLRAGAAKVDITPAQSELTIATDSIRDRLYVRAIYVEEGTASAVLVAVDSGGIGDDVITDAINRSSAATGCPAANYVISATHTHSGGQGPAMTRVITQAIVSAVNAAKAKLAPARIGYGTAELDLNVNRDLFNAKQEWRQGPNPAGASDKTLSVVTFVGEDDVPIGVYMNYAMHPINFYLSGVVSADFPGDAARYVEELFDDRTVALFTQGASGDQNPRLGYTPPYSTNSFRQGLPPSPLTIGPPKPLPEANSQQGFNPATASAGRPAVPAEHLEVYHKVLKRVSDYVTMLGHMIGSTAVRVMREDTRYKESAAIWAGQETFTVPGRTRLDLDNPARENVFPGYKDGPDVSIKVGLLRIGDIHFVSVNGEVYTNIWLKLKAAAPASQTVFVTLANGRANSGYIYSDDAYHHLSFQVIGSRLQPGHAEGKIISTALQLMERSR
ncbi:MAG TPA: neutral/alkaline non-lysosomal ceramidase N-terminal domain-containing protein [Opitutaceae bacterium]